MEKKFESETAMALIKCIRALGHQGVIECCISELQGIDFGRPNLTEKEIQEELYEWLEGFKKTGDKKFQTKKYKQGIK